ncbi:MAG: hypothetical protein A2Z88_10880, partial [Omnitrophica WOR_2 bacterium GWA2_47_8]
SACFDEKDPKSIEAYAKQLVNKRLRDFLSSQERTEISKVFGKRGKGYFGNLIEKYYFGISPNSSSSPDFPQAGQTGVELKTVPLKELKDGSYTRKERLVLGIINYKEIVTESWESSSFLKKNSLLLVIFYLWVKNILPIDYVIKIVNLWECSGDDLRIIRQDWEYIVTKIKEGKAQELSEGDTFYLGACTKGVDASSMREQLGTTIKAKQRALAFKTRYVKVMLETLSGIKKDAEPIVKDFAKHPKSKTFEQIVIDKFDPFLGKSVEEIHRDTSLRITKRSKDYYAWLTRAILGVKKKNIEEFDKADVAMKIIRLHKNGMPKESMSFPAIRYAEIINEEWNTSTFRELVSKKFFFVIFKYDDAGILRLKKVMFWHVPYNDLETHVKRCWQETVRRIKEKRAHELPKLSDNPVCHVRPHGRNKRDTSMTHYGIKVQKQSFWLNARYLKNQVSIS